MAAQLQSFAYCRTKGCLLFFIQIKQRWTGVCCKIIRLLSARRAAFGEKAAKKEGIREPWGHVETHTHTHKRLFDGPAAIQAVGTN
jgi:hypothetical protein